eukprot:9047-Heterococcus_DN1.PRE.2
MQIAVTGCTELAPMHSNYGHSLPCDHGVLAPAPSVCIAVHISTSTPVRPGYLSMCTCKEQKTRVSTGYRCEHACKFKLMTSLRWQDVPD